MPETATEKSPFIAPKKVSPKMGINTIKKENFATSSFFTPNNKPVAMVVPERERPGKTATACANPIRKAMPHPMGLS
jgi:hypothetical protein